jgi:hypothetical protein
VSSLHLPGSKISWQDIGGKNSFSFGTSRGSPELDAQVCLELLEDVLAPTYNKRGAIYDMTSPTIGRVPRYNKSRWRSEGPLGCKKEVVTVCATSIVSDVQYYDHYRVATVLTGTQVIVAFPPSHANLSAIKEQLAHTPREQRL